MKKLTLMLVCLVMSAWSVFAQTNITGTVISTEDGEPVLGASIVVKGTTVGTVTDLDGKFSLSVPANAKTLLISYVGMETKEETIKPQMHIKLSSASQQIDEVMVVAYGTAKKASFTGSADIIKSEKISSRPVSNITKTLDGLVTGVQTTSGSGQPGASSSIIIRGYGSINASRDPLYVVDGVPYDGNISSLSPNDIESLTVLKDASAGALYGSRGANGVIMITTKRGVAGKPTVTLKANWGFASRAIPRYDTMNEKQYIETLFQSFKNQQINGGVYGEAAGLAAINAMVSGPKKMFGENEQYNPYNFKFAELIDPNTGIIRSDARLNYHNDWIDEATASNPLRQEYQFQVGGGQNKNKYMFSLGYLNEDGLLKTTNFERYTGRMSVDSEVTQWFKAGLSANFALTNSNSNVAGTSTTDGSNSTGNVFYAAQLMGPIFPVYQLDSNFKPMIDETTGKVLFDYGLSRPTGAQTNFNNVAMLYDDKYKERYDNLSARTYVTLGDLKEGALRGLKLDVTLGVDYYNRNTTTYYNPYFGNADEVKGRLYKENRRTFSYTLNQLLSYNRTFGKHTVDALVGHEFYSYQYNYMMGHKTGFPFGDLYELNAASTVQGTESYQDKYAIESVLSRVNYDFDNRYYLSASFRTDGSSRFHKDFRWGQFWSVGANWRISQEKFMEDIDWLNNLSLKASFGVQGNDNVLTYYAWQALYDLTYSNDSFPGAFATTLENKNLRWEMNHNLNIGVEAKMFNRLSASIEWYQRESKNMLLDYPMASSSGFDGYLKNVGDMRNTGVEVTLSGKAIKTKDFDWDVTLMGSTVSNKVLRLADKPEIVDGSFIIKEGEAVNSFYVPESAGVDPLSGKQLYWVWDTKDGVAGEPYISSNMAKASSSRKIMGNRIPSLYGSITNQFRYKGFDLNLQCNYSIGGKVLDGIYNEMMYGYYTGQAKHVDMLRAWKQPGDLTDVPRVDIGPTYQVTNDRLINASYFAIKNITLGYTLPERLTRKIQLQNVRFSAIADNVALFTHLKGMDPQYDFKGQTSYVYTPTRTISFGIDIKF